MGEGGISRERRRVRRSRRKEKWSSERQARRDMRRGRKKVRRSSRIEKRVSERRKRRW